MKQQSTLHPIIETARKLLDEQAEFAINHTTRLIEALGHRTDRPLIKNLSKEELEGDFDLTTKELQEAEVAYSSVVSYYHGNDYIDPAGRLSVHIDGLEARMKGMEKRYKQLTGK